MNHVLITGASTGIGYDAARYLIDKGWHVFGSVRKQADADRVQSALGHNFTPLLFDVTDHAAIHTAAEQVANKVGDSGLQGLVNNAGIAVPGPLMHLSIDDFRHQIEVNLVGQLAVTQAFLSLLGASKQAAHPPGRIVNISSVSGRIAYPFLGPYAISKHGLEAFSDVLRRELLIYGIDVIVIQPASIQTPIWDKAGEIDPRDYIDTDYADIVRPIQESFVTRGQAGIPVEVVSETIWKALSVKKPKTRYPIIRKFLIGWFLPRFLPDRILDKFMADRMGIKR